MRWAWASCATRTVVPPPYAAPRLNAACFRAMGVGVLGDAFLCFTPPPTLNAARLNAMVADAPLLRCTPCTAVRVSAAHFYPILLRFVQVLAVYPTVRLGATLMLRFWWMVSFVPLSSLYTWLLPSPMLDGVEARVLLYAETPIYRYSQQGHHNKISASIASLRVVSMPPLSPTHPLSAALLTDNKQHVYQ